MDRVLVLVAVWFLFGAIFFAGAADIYSVMKKAHKDTVSGVILDLSRNMPILILAAGFLLGHLFWPQGGNGK